MVTARNKTILGTISLLLIVVFSYPITYGKIIYVDDDSMGANDGTSWENVYNFLQDALAFVVEYQQFIVREQQWASKPFLRLRS